MNSHFQLPCPVLDVVPERNAREIIHPGSKHIDQT